MEHSEAGSKRSRKPYTLTKARESWSNDEHERFIKALQLYNRDWKKIETYVGTKTVVQIRSHAQKYFQKIMKSGITDAIPPPRPKRRASDPPHGGASCHTDAKHARLLSEHPTSRQGSGKDEDSDEGMLQHHSHAQHLAQHHHQQQHHSSKQHTAELMEPSAQLESSRTLISSQGLQHVYLYLASLFSQPQADLAGMLQRLSTRDRHILAALLKSLVEELNHQQHAQPHTLHSDQQQQHLQEGDQHHQHAAEHQDQLLQQQQHVSGGSGGQSNGATVNTTAGTAPAADAADPAYAAALPASAAAAAVGDAGVAQEGLVPPVKLEPGTVSAAAASVAAPSGQPVGGFSQQQLQQQGFLPASAGTAIEHQPEHGSQGLQSVQPQPQEAASQQVQQQPLQEAPHEMQQQGASGMEASAQQDAPVSPARQQQQQQQQQQLAQAQMQQEPWQQASSGQGSEAVHAADPGSSAATAGAAVAGNSPSQQLQQQESDAHHQQQQVQQVEQQPEAMIEG